jgi:membrane protease YdiL (CAAX protease family)
METSMPPAAGLLRGKAAYAPRTPWRPLSAAAATIGIILAGVLAGGLFLRSGSLQGLLPRTGLSEEQTVLLGTLALWQVVTIVLTFAASRLFGGRAREVLALGPPVGGVRVYVGGVAAMVLLQAFVSSVQYYSGTDDRFADLRPMVQLVGGSQWLFALLVVGIGAPLSEELLFRGFLFSALAARLPIAAAAFATSLAWTALHYGYTAIGLLEVFLVGLLFAWLLWRTGSLRVAIFCHALYNSLIILVLRHVPLPS